jgi:hypothetical protein
LSGTSPVAPLPGGSGAWLAPGLGLGPADVGACDVRVCDVVAGGAPGAAGRATGLAEACVGTLFPGAEAGAAVAAADAAGVAPRTVGAGLPQAAMTTDTINEHVNHRTFAGFATGLPETPGRGTPIGSQPEAKT